MLILQNKLWNLNNNYLNNTELTISTYRHAVFLFITLSVILKKKYATQNYIYRNGYDPD